MEIANPIYYAALRYLMQDDRAARLLVGRIAGLEVESLEPRPLELEAPREATRRGDAEVDQPPVALFHMNFTARVRTAGGGERHVPIEIQKTNAPTSVERFRVWLGRQPSSTANVIEHPSGRRPSAPVVTIYLLGYDLEIADEPVLDVFPRVTARRTGAEIDAAHPFIAGIHHRSHIVQIPLLRGRRRDDLERVLSIFDQGEARIERAPALMLTIDRPAYPAEYDFVPRRLHQAASETEVRRFMEGEDQLLRDFICLGRQAEYWRREKERLRAHNERARAERARREREMAEEERERQRADRAEQVLSRAIRRLHGLGQDAAAIAAGLSMDADEVRRVLADADGGEGSA